MLLLFLLRKLNRYVCRLAKACFRHELRVPNLICLLFLVYLTGVLLTAQLILGNNPSRQWHIEDATEFAKHRHPDLGVSYLPAPFVPGNFGSWKSKYDPRLVPALWLNSIRQTLRNSRLGLDTPVSLPFRWESYLDLLPRVVTPVLGPAHVDTCVAFETAFHVHDLAGFCEEKLEKDPLRVFPGIRITGPTDSGLDEQTRMYVGANYLMHLTSVPLRAVFLGVGPGDAENRALVVPLHLAPSLYQRMDVVSLVDSYLDACIGCSTISLSSEVEKLQHSWAASDRQVHFGSGFSVASDTLRFENSAQNADMTLAASHFVHSPALLHSYFDARVYTAQPSATNLDRLLSDNHADFRDANCSEKYFHEAQFIGTSRGSHFDWRFFQKADYSAYEHQAIMHRMARAWLHFAGSANLCTWLAHGTLLGWYWNGLNMPWDLDMDVQMTMESLFVLARNYNQTVVVDVAGSAHLYFVDVSPHIFDRTHGNGNNVIDARFIDTYSGMYVDITGLAVSDDFRTNSLARSVSQLHKVFDTEYTNVARSALEDPAFFAGYLEELRETEEHAWNNGHLYNCKNFHFYTMLELLPLRKTTFEGEQAYVPARFDAILRREYTKGMLAREYGSWVFRPFLDLWVRKKQCRSDPFGSECHDKSVLLEEQATRPMRLARKKWFGGDRLGVARVDLWMMRRNEQLWKSAGVGK